MRFWKFSQDTKLKQNFFTDIEKEVGNFFKTGTIVLRGPDDPTHSCWSETCYSMVPKLCDF